MPPIFSAMGRVQVHASTQPHPPPPHTRYNRCPYAAALTLPEINIRRLLVQAEADRLELALEDGAVVLFVLFGSIENHEHEVAARGGPFVAQREREHERDFGLSDRVHLEK